MDEVCSPRKSVNKAVWR